MNLLRCFSQTGKAPAVVEPDGATAGGKYGLVSAGVTARVAGLWYLLLAACAYFTHFVDGAMYVPGDAAATAAHIRASVLLIRFGIVGDLVGEVGFLLAALAFYRLFERVDARRAKMLLSFVAASVPIVFAAAVTKFAPIVLLGGAGYLRAFEPAQLEALAMLFVELQKYGTIIVSVIWGLWLLPLGILAYRSGFFPKVFGVLLVVNFAAYMANELMAFFFPVARQLAAPYMSVLLIIGEIPFLFWLLIRGAGTKRAPA
jgi:hypothetical protein